MKRGPRLLVVCTTKCVRSTICVVLAGEIAAHQRPAQQVGARAPVQAVERVSQRAIAVEIARGQAGHQRISSGVPTGSSRARRAMSALRRRMQPCETRPGTRSGWLVPWMPT